MNHPSDYMNNFQDDLSSDSSNPTVKIPLFPKSRPVRSLHQPRPRPPKKPAKPMPPAKKPKGAGNGGRKERAASEYLILGDSYYFQSSKVKELSKRFVQEQRSAVTRVMQVQRLKRKEQKCIVKIEAYIRTFVQGIAITNAIRSLNTHRKLTLYRILKEEQEQMQQQEKKEPLDEYFQLALQRVEQLSVDFHQQFPHKGRAISRWKNHRLHQLSSAKNFLSQQDCNLESQLPVLEEEKFFPELREQAAELHSCIAIHLQQQQEKSVVVGGSGEEDAGVRWVLAKLLSFILEHEEILCCVLARLQESAYPLLEDELFIVFEREVIGNGQDEEERYIHMFNKAIFDLLNQTAPSLLPLCPHQAFDQVLSWLFQMAPTYEPEDDMNGQNLLRADEAVFDAIIEEALWDFLEWL